MSVVVWLLAALVAWSALACVVGFLVGGAARLRDQQTMPGGPGLSRSAVTRAA